MAHKGRVVLTQAQIDQIKQPMLPRLISPEALRARVPSGDLLLSDGRRLVNWSAFYGDASGGNRWVTQAPDGQRMAVIATMDNTDDWGPLLHVSLSYADHLPSWEDVRVVKDAFYGDRRDAMMLLPRASHYVNLHPYTMHLYETPEDWNVL